MVYITEETSFIGYEEYSKRGEKNGTVVVICSVLALTTEATSVATARLPVFLTKCISGCFPAYLRFNNGPEKMATFCLL